MDAVFLHGIKDLRIGPLPEPSRAGGQVPLSVSTVGICGSDLHYYLEGGIGSAQVRSPFVPGHEFAGRVLEDREDLGLRQGQLVAVDPAKPCGRCEWCHAGYPNLCPHVEFTGAPPFQGALTRTLMAEPGQIFPVPDGMTAVQAVAAKRGLAVARERSLDTGRSDAARYRRGTEVYAELIEDGERMIRAPFETMAPDLGDTTFQIFGDVYAREGISLRQRQIATVATLAALDNGGRQLRLHIGTALHVGVTQNEIVEILMLLQAHAGMPAAYNGLLAAREVFAESGQPADVYDE